MENLAYFLIGVGNPLHSIYVGTSNFTVAKELFPSNQSDSVRHSFDRRLVYLGLSATPVLPWWGGVQEGSYVAYQKYITIFERQLRPW